MTVASGTTEFTIARTSGRRSGAVLVRQQSATVRAMTTSAIATTIGAKHAIVNHAIGTAIAASTLGTCSCAISICRADWSELVHDRDRDYTLDASESRTLATVGAFRIVSERDLRDPWDDAFDLRHLEDQG